LDRPPGRVLVLVTPCERAVWLAHWPRADLPLDGLDAWRCSVFRNEGAGLSSELIEAAMALTAERWSDRPADGWLRFTWIDATKVASSNPGYYFKQAGWWVDREWAHPRAGPAPREDRPGRTEHARPAGGTAHDRHQAAALRRRLHRLAAQPTGLGREGVAVVLDVRDSGPSDRRDPRLSDLTVFDSLTGGAELSPCGTAKRLLEEFVEQLRRDPWGSATATIHPSSVPGRSEPSRVSCRLHTGCGSGWSAA
jgi:hypothetical protein